MLKPIRNHVQRQIRFHVLLGVLVFCLSVPLDAVAQTKSLPSDFEISFPDLGATIVYTKTAGGYEFMDLSSPDIRGTVSNDVLDDFDVVVLKEDLDGFSANFNLPDGHGGNTEYAFSGSVSRLGDFSGTLMRQDGTVVGPISGTLPGIDPGASAAAAVVVVIVAIVGLALLGCAVAQWLTDCGSECVGACGQGNVQEYEELRCGRCSCACQRG